MKNFTKLLCTVALLFAAVGGVNATKKYADLSKVNNILGNASWNNTTNTLSWDASSNNLIDLPDLVGDWSEYTSIKLETSDLLGGGQFRLMVYFNNTPETIVMYSAGSKDLNFSERFSGKDLSKVTQVRLGGAGSDNGSVVITKVYLDGKPFSLEFDEKGVADIDVTDLTANGCFSFDDQTGILTSNSGTSWGQLKVNLPSGGVDFSNVTNISLTYEGDGDIINTLEIEDELNGKLGTFYSSKYTLDFTSYANKASQVNKMLWSAPYQSTKNATMTIKSIKLTANTIKGSVAGETVLNKLSYYNFKNGSPADATWNVGTTTDTYFGSGSSDASNYVNLTDYSELRIYRDDNTGFRAFFINAAGTGTNNITQDNPAVTWNGERKYFSIDLSKVEKYDSKVYLNTIKSTSWGVNNVVNNIVVYNEPASNTPQYSLNGSGVFIASALAVLADADATSIDATGITKATALTITNPNCLIVANEGMVTNANNVIVGGTCASLVLTDSHPFKAPADFTATNASYTTTIDATAKAGTLCLPFAAAIPEGVKAYTLTYTGGGNAVATELEGTIPANKPVLLNGSGVVTFTGTSVVVNAEATNVNGAMTGVFEAGTVPQNSYVLQNGASGVGFYKVTTDDIAINPFRAYLTAQTGGAARLNIIFPEETTGIKTVQGEGFMTKGSETYNLQGQRVAQPVKGLYILNGKKVIKK